MRKNFIPAIVRSILSALILGAALLSLVPSLPIENAILSRAPYANAESPETSAVTGKAAVDRLKEAGEYDSLASAMDAASYYIDTRKDAGSYTASNKVNRFFAEFNGGRLRLAGGGEKSEWQLNWQLESVGYGPRQIALASAGTETRNSRIEIERHVAGDPATPILTEWFENTSAGLEQGFVLPQRPTGDAFVDEKLRLVFSVGGDLVPKVIEDGKAVDLTSRSTADTIRYEKLKVWDAEGTNLTAAMRVDNGDVLLEVNDAIAVYPITIDPTFARAQKITAPDGASEDRFGSAVAVDGNTVVLGAVNDDVGANTNQGSAYVFVRNGRTWTWQQKLTANDGAEGDQFGIQVDIQGNTIVVGASSDDVGANANQGSAYVFTRTGTSWSQLTKITASDGVASDTFGSDVAISGDTIVVGAPNDQAGESSGSAYVLVRNGAVFTEQAKLTVPASGPNLTVFGGHVAIDGNTVIVQAKGATGVFTGAAIFARNGTVWSSQFSRASTDSQTQTVDVNGNYAVIDGTVYVRSGTTWNFQQDVEASTVPVLRGDTLVAGTTIYVRSGSTWTFRQTFSDQFATALDFDGSTIILGNPEDDIAANANPGAASIYSTTAGVEFEQQLLAADGQDGDRLGKVVAIEQDTAVVGAPMDDFVSSADQGSALVFRRGFDGEWGFAQKLIASDGAPGDQFGAGVAIEGNRIIVGAPLDDNGLFIDTGSAYYFVWNGFTWTQQQRFLPPDGLGGDQFARSIKLAGDYVVGGSRFANVSGNSDQGAAYVFKLNAQATSWVFSQKLVANDGAAGDGFGFSVDMIPRIVFEDAKIVVGAPLDTIGANANQGSAYVFNINGDTFVQTQKLTVGTAGDTFGTSVAIGEKLLLVGAPSDDVGAFNDMGSVWVYEFNGTTWSQEDVLRPPDGLALHGFGISLDISYAVAVVGSYANVNGNGAQGAAYVFHYQGPDWLFNTKLSDPAGSSSDLFSESVAISNNNIVIGVNGEDNGANANQGAASYYRLTFGAGSTPFDFDGDGKTDLGIFRPSVAEWWINRSSSGSVFAAQFGLTTDRIVPGDYTGDGKADVAVWRPSNGNWIVLRSEDLSFFAFPFGTTGDIPVPGDYDVDGKIDAAVFRPSNATWYIRRSSDGGSTIEAFGANGDVPVPADYDGDGETDLAIFRPSNGQWWLNRSTAGVIATTFGNSGDKPVQGDYTGDAKSDIAFWRPSTGEWFVLRSEDFSFFSFPFGTVGDVPAPGDYDGDGRHDATVFRGSNATWYSQRTTAGTLIQQFGSTGDRPIPNAFVP